jgi:hypothetical protein
MAVISFSESSQDAAWVVAGWAFRQALADVCMMLPADSEANAALHRAEEVGYLMLDYLDPAVAAKLTSAFKETASEILAGKVTSGVIERLGDPSTTEEYFVGLKMMLNAVQAAEGKLT